MKKYFIVISSFLIMSALGGLYAWSIFVPPLKEQIGVSTGFTQLIFGIIIGILPVAMVFGGKLLNKNGPLFTGIISGILFGSGYIIAGKSGAQPLYLIIGIGLISGVGTGFGYITALSTPVKWFPERRGLITGIATSGFGAGAIFLSFIAKELLERNIPIANIFTTIGITYGLVIILSSLLLKNPKKELPAPPSSLHLDFLKDRSFWALFVGMFSGTFAGLIIIGNLRPIAIYFKVNQTAAILAISSLSIGNTIGRILWGHIADRIGIEKSIRLSLVLLAVLIPLYTIAKTSITFITLSMLVGLAFGANFVIYATAASMFYGIDKISEVYPFISFSYGIGGLTGPSAGGYIFDFTKNYIYSLVIASIIALVGCALSLYLIKRLSSRRLTTSTN